MFEQELDDPGIPPRNRTSQTVKIKLMPILVLLISSIYFLISGSPVFAESPAGFPLVPCATTIPGEFHPLRPYPGTPCNTTIPLNTPIFCGAGSFSHDVDVPATCGGKKDCTFTKNVEYDVTVDLTQVRIPILGNTQDDLDEATQVNNYLNWYLNGTVQQSEQWPLTSPEDTDRLVNFSGPLKKLLPFDSQNSIRSGLVDGPVGSGYHNYIVGCKKDFDWGYIKDLIVNTIRNNLASAANFLDLVAKMATLPFDDFKIVIKALSQLTTNPQDFNALSALSQLLGVSTGRLVAFANALGNQWQIFDSQLNTISLDMAEACSTSNDTKRLTDFRDHLDVFWLQNIWAQLFQNIPFSSFEDTVGEISFSAPGSQPDGVGPVRVTVTPTKNKVFLPHLKSLDKLSTLATRLLQPYSPTGPIPVVPTTSGLCTITKAYSLPTGDSLLGPKMKLHLKYSQTFTYDADTSASPPATLSRPSTVSVNTNSQTPLIDNIFWNLVGSPQSLIKRFAPQTSQIKDGDSAIPAAATDPGGHEVLFAKIGSLFDHILGGALENINLQRLLRPQGPQSPISNFQSQATPKPNHGDYEIAYDSVAKQYIISIFNINFDKTRITAEQDLIKRLNISTDSACKLNIIISSPVYINPSAPLSASFSFCK